MSQKINDRYVEELMQQLIIAIQTGNRQQELNIRSELKECGLLSGEEVETLEELV